MNFSKKNYEHKKKNRTVVSKVKLTIIALLIGLVSLAQTGINYKALIKDTNGNVVSNSDIEIQFELLQGLSMDTVYREIHNPTTDDNGIVVLIIGQGTTQDDIRDVNWSLGEVLINVQIDIGNGLVDFGTTEFQYVPFAYAAEVAIEAKNVTGLEAIDEGNGVGWRLIGSDPANYGNIGFRATDLSYSNLESSTYGATGTNSVVMGYRTSANGDSSVAIGSDSAASDDFSTAIGAGAIASGSSSTALGIGTQATENSSMAIGYFTNASEFASTTLGYFTEASGQYATATGNNTRAQAYNSFAVGRFNNGNGNATTWNSFDPLFEIGNGSSDTDRNNALTVYKSGRHVINSEGSGLSIYSEGRGLYIYSPNSVGMEIEESEGDGIVINSAGNDGIVVNSANDDGLVINANDYGARITGNTAGLYVSGGTALEQADVPDIILGTEGPSVVNLNDDGIITTNPLRASSDMYLRSYDAVVVQLDYDNNETGNFRIRNGTDDIVFDINESGNINMDGNITMDGRLRIGTANLENINTDFLQFNKSTIPSADGQFSLGASSRRWANLWAVDGTINTSDRRSKKHIKALDYGLKEVLQMNPVSFKWKDRKNQDTKLGLIAQDLLEIVPEAVKTHTWKTTSEENSTLQKVELDRLGVYYSDLIPVLIKAIQEQQEIINKQQLDNDLQKAELSELKDNYQSLLSRIEIIESKTSN